MQTVAHNQSQMTSLEAVQIQTGEINQRFTNLESFLEQSFQSILTILSQQKSQMDGMSVALGKFKQDSLAMSQQIRSLLFCKKTQASAHDLVNRSPKQIEVAETGLFSNCFQLGDSLNQIKFSELEARKTSAKQSKKFGFLEEVHEKKSNSMRDSKVLNNLVPKNHQINFEPFGNDSEKESIRETPNSRKSLTKRQKVCLIRFETPQGTKEIRERQRKKNRLNPPKLKNRSSLISKKQKPEIRRKKFKSRKMRQMQNSKGKANLNMLADKLGQLEFGNDDLQSRKSNSFQDQSHFLDKVSRSNSRVSHFDAKNREPSHDIPSLGVFGQSSFPSGKLEFNFPKPQHSSLDQFLHKQQKQAIQLSAKAQSNNVHFSNQSGSMMVPSLHLESSYTESAKGLQPEDHLQNVSGRTIQIPNSKTGEASWHKKDPLRTPSLAGMANLSIFSVNRQKVNSQCKNQSKQIPLLPNLQSSIKTPKDVPLNQEKMIPVFDLSQQESHRNQSKRDKLVNNQETRFRQNFNIRDPLVGEKTPSTINHSRLQKNLNAIQFDFSYHTGFETKESVPEFAHFESKESSQLNRSKFDITPLQNQPQNRRLAKFVAQNELRRDWSINQIPKSAYLDKVRSKFPDLKNGLKINAHGQMSINDSAFSNQMNFPWTNVQTVKSSSDKFGLQVTEAHAEEEVHCWPGQEHPQKVKKGFDLEEDNSDNQSVRTANQLSSRKQLPDFEYSKFEASMFSADLGSRDSKLTRKQHEEVHQESFNLGKELGELPRNEFFDLDFQVPDIQNHVNDSQFNTSLLDQLNQKEEFFPKAKANNFGLRQSHGISRPSQSPEQEDLGFENEGFGPILKELKTQLDAAHYKMFDAKFDVKFEELTRKLKEYCFLERDINFTESILRKKSDSLGEKDKEKLRKIFRKRNIRVDLGKLEWTERLGQVCASLQTSCFEDSLRKLMRDPSGFNSFLILVKKRLLEQEILFQNSF